MSLDAWPLILQHVREIADAHIAAPERAQLKVLTPFPPVGPDFPDFTADSLQFLDRPDDGATASQDTLRAFEFARRTDQLYYDYSYGIRSEEYRLSDLCTRFFHNAKVAEDADDAFRAGMTEVGNAYLVRYKRSTAGDLGLVDFRYTAPSMVSWLPQPFDVSGTELARLTGKATQVYEDVGAEATPLVTPILAELAALRLASFSYELGMFDIVRPWFEPRLLSHAGWAFSDGSRTLYGETDPVFADDSVHLAVAQRFYVVRHARSTPLPAEQPTPPIVRDATLREAMKVSDRVLGAVARRNSRNTLMARGLERAAVMRAAGLSTVRTASVAASAVASVTASAAASTTATAPPARAGYVWIAPTATVPGHWERTRATPTTTPAPEPASPPPETWLIAAVRCRVLPRT